MGHLELVAQHGEGQLSLNQFQSILAESIETPPFKHGKIAHAAGQKLQFLAAREQASRGVDLARADLQQQLQQVGNQRAFLAQRGATRRARRQLLVRQRLGLGQRGHEPATDLVVLPARRQAAHLGKVGLHLGRVAGEVGQRLVLGDAAARQVLVLRLQLAPAAQRLQPPQHCRVAPGGLDPGPGPVGVVAVIVRVGELFHLGIKPVAAPGFFKPSKDFREDLRKMGNVADGIFDLALG